MRPFTARRQFHAVAGRVIARNTCFDFVPSWYARHLDAGAVNVRRERFHRCQFIVGVNAAAF